MTALSTDITQRERELAAIVTAYNEVTDKLKESHVELRNEVRRLREELARKNEQLRRKERLAALGEMAAGVAHEIRNPLGGIQVFASLLRQDLIHQPDAVERIDKIRKGVTQLESIVSDILDFARPAGPVPRIVQLRSLVAETVELSASRMAAAGVAVDVGDSFDDVELVTDGMMLQRALMNLLLNAIDATKGHGRRVRITLLASDEQCVTIGVCDEGPGIDVDTMESIFNPFFTTKDTGTGLGLAIVHQIIDTLGGSVSALNLPEGGAMFTLIVPRRYRPAGAPMTESSPPLDRVGQQ